MGLAGKPEQAQDFIRFTAQGVHAIGKTDIYLALEIWEGLELGTARLEVLMPGHGRFWLRFERSADGR